SYMMRIESSPVTRNGKLDKRALPDIEIKTSSEYVAPRNDEEKALCEAFKAMLGVEKVSVKDSFFELGGDSIKAIRVVSDMRSRGYTITVKDILNRRTPETIALYVTKAEEESYEQGEVTGIVTQTPVIRDFRYCQMRRPEHYNQAMMVPVESDRDSICHALDALVLHHDILRAVYVNDKLEILGYENSKKYEISEYDVRGHVDVEKEIEKLCSEEQAHIDLKNGPLMRVALFETDFGKYMMMCIHHLAVDGVSWRILLEDFDSALEAVKSGKDVKLPAKTASFIEWSKALDEYRSSEELLEEKSFWNEFEMHKDENRLSIPEGVRSETINRYKTVKLSEEITENLLRRAGYAYNTQINDLLLASLGIAIGKLTGQEAVSVGVEGHGRESIHKPINIDRTVGWFTSMYPVELGCSGNTETTIVETKDMLHEVPNNGLGYELLYDTDLGSCVDVYFNYLGEIDSENQNEKKSFSVGECVSPENRLPGIFSINSWVENKQFVCEICSNLCSDAYADEFAKLYLEAVTQVVSWCVSQKKQHITESDMYGLTPLQEGMYFHNELDHEDQSYRIQESFKANMRVEISSLQISLDCLAEKYDVLKTSFAKTRKGEIRQYIDPDKCIEICEVKYEQVFSVDLLKEYSEKDLKRGFNLKTDSLLRVAVLSFADFDVLFFSSHHLIIDGWCTPIVYEDLVRFYNLCLSGTDKKTLSEMVKDEKRFILPFREYVEWLGRIKKSDVEKFWNTYLEEYDSVAEIQPVEKVVNVPDAAVLEKMIVLDPELTAKLGSLAKNCNSTISSVMQMIFGLLLQKHCGLDDVLVGNVVSGRNVPLKGIENAVGMFINTVPLRIHTESTEDTIKELLIRLQTSNNESNSYDSVSLGELNVAGSQVSEYIKHLFVFENYPGTDETSEETQFAIEELYTREQTNYSITMCAFMLDDKMAVRFSYDPKSYTAGNIDLLLTHLKTIADRVAEDPERKVSELCISDENEKEQVLHAFNNTSFDYPKETTIVELFEKRVSDCPDAIALEMGEQTLTYAQLNEKANQLAHILREKHGVKPNDFVAILAERSMEMIVGIYGIIKAGGAYVPMDPTYPEDRIAYMLEDSKTKAVLTYKTSIKTDIPVIDLEDQELYSEAKENLPIVNAADDLIYCIYTSGTTGKPKGVMIENRSLNNYLLTVGKKFYIYEGIVPLITNYVFDLTVTAIIGSLLLEKTLRIFKTENELARYASEKDVAVLKITPSHLSLVMEESEKYGVCKIHALMLGGEAVTKNLVTRIKDKLGEDVVIINEYGPTEATVATTYSILERDEDITIGKPFYNTQIHIVSGNALCGIGVPGELCIAGDPVAKGYLNRPELTTEKFVKNPYGDGRMYHTGDLARWLPDGNIECLGRIDEQVKIRGFRIELGEIESRIREITDVKDCAVIARTDASGDKALYAYIVSDNEVQVSEIREELSKNLPEYMIPSYLMQIERIPITRNGKLDKRALPDIEAKTGGEYVAPRNDTEETLCEIFGEILNVEKVSVKDSFFALGGHSLRATRLVNRIEAETGTRIALKDIFSNPTPEKLAEMISKEETTEYVSIPKAEEKEFYPMSSAQQRTYLICQMDPDGILYNMSQNLIIKGDVQPERLKQALQKVMDRHEILRTVFLMVDGQPVQKILDHVEADFSYTEELVSSDAELISEFTRPFDLSKAPLVRIGLVKRNGYFLLNIDMHHIVGDGMSVGTFTKELNAFYNGEEVAPLTHQFKDYSEWMRTRDLSGQAEYWKSQFDEEVPVLDMPLDFARPQVQSNKGAMIYRNSGRELGERIKKLAAKTESTDFMVLLSSLMVLLSKYSRQEDIVVGTPISGRTHKDTESMMGMFINTLAMRGRPEGKKSYLEFLSEIKETSLKAYENQEYPFE
ncbi:MAG: amino acid adenylation domain-containing protein, partial [Solobacterium sp.]|nr:amino acid adenylation domain-containing protein [Solobacterium sp.]